MSEPSKCPLCGKPAALKFAPFCGQRCADLDLGRWLKGGYVVPGVTEETDTPESKPPSEEDDP